MGIAEVRRETEQLRMRQISLQSQQDKNHHIKSSPLIVPEKVRTSGEHLTCSVGRGEVVEDRREDGSQHGGSWRTIQSISSLQLHAALGLFKSVTVPGFCASAFLEVKEES